MLLRGPTKSRVAFILQQLVKCIIFFCAYALNTIFLAVEVLSSALVIQHFNGLTWLFILLCLARLMDSSHNVPCQ